MIGEENITKEDEQVFFDIRFYLELYMIYIATLKDIKKNQDENDKKMSFIDIFKNYIYPEYDYLKNCNPTDAFKTMIAIFNQISGLYMLSLTNDEMLKKIDDAYLKKIEPALNELFVDKSYCNQFDNRQIVTYLRNAVSHNENGKLYKALRNGTIEIKLDNVPSKDKSLKPFHVIINTYSLHLIADHLYQGIYQYFIPSFDVIKEDLFYKNDEQIADVLKSACYYKGYTRYDTKKEISNQVKQSFYVHPNVYTEQEQIDDLRKMVEEGTINNKVFKYDEDQINAFIACIHRIKNLGFVESDFVDPFDLALRISNHSIYPNPAIRLEEMRMMYKYTNDELSNVDNSIDSINKRWSAEIAQDPDAYMTEKDVYMLFSEIECMISTAIYFYYVFGHMLSNDRTIECNGITYDLNRIRDSFIHGTWFSYYDKNDKVGFYNSFKYVLYDCNNGQKNEGKWNWKSHVMNFSEIANLSNKVVIQKMREKDGNDTVRN